MGKTSKWIINFLLGKKDEKEKKKKKREDDDCKFLPFYEDGLTTPNANIPSTPTYRRRWSFGKSSSKEKVHKSSRSLDSITPLITQHASSSLDWENNKTKKTKTAATAVASPTEAIKRIVVSKLAADRITKSVDNAAATRIQAAFRSYLARKALCALKGLVKLQALVRGHLERKKTTAILRQMHALMSIQIRARFQRLQMAEEASQLAVRSQSSRHGNFYNDNGLRRANEEAIDLNVYETRRVVKDKHGCLNHSPMEKRKHKPMKYYSGELYISRQEDRYDDFTFPTAPNRPQICSPTIPGRASFTYQKPDYVQHSIYHRNYMANTKSSRAKVRSQSEPKQRPQGNMKPKGKQTASVDVRNAQHDAQTQVSSTQSIPVAPEIEDPWFIKLDQTTSSKGGDCDAKSIASSSYSNYSKLLVTYEPHLNMY